MGFFRALGRKTRRIERKIDKAADYPAFAQRMDARVERAKQVGGRIAGASYREASKLMSSGRGVNVGKFVRNVGRIGSGRSRFRRLNDMLFR